MPYGGGGPSATQTVKHLRQASAADFSSGAGHSLELHHTPLEEHGVPWHIGHGTPEPPQRLRPRNSAVPSCRSTQGQRVVSADPPRESQPRERGSPWGLGAASPSRCARATVPAHGTAPGLSSSSSCTVCAVSLRKEQQQGSPRCGPVSPWARALPAVGRQRPRVADQTRGPACAGHTQRGPA